MISNEFCFIKEINNSVDANKALKDARLGLFNALRDLIYKIEGSMERVKFYGERIVEINKLIECF